MYTQGCKRTAPGAGHGPSDESVFHTYPAYPVPKNVVLQNIVSLFTLVDIVMIP